MWQKPALASSTSSDCQGKADASFDYTSAYRPCETTTKTDFTDEYFDQTPTDIHDSELGYCSVRVGTLVAWGELSSGLHFD